MHLNYIEDNLNMKKDNTDKMLEVNIDQADYYNSISLGDDKQEQTGYGTHNKANLLTKIWAKLRYKQQDAFQESGLEGLKEKFHHKWIDSKKGGNSLEIGCFRGTNYSLPLIEASGKYLGVDLSENAVEFFNNSLEKKGLSSKANGKALDFLLMDDSEKYDLIFAHGVLHHFEHPEPLFDKISNLLKDDGILLLTEPSEVNYIYSTLRRMYRPFQSDSAWEWPFSKQTIRFMEKDLKAIDGFGWGRWSLMVSVIQGIPVIEYIANPFYKYLLRKEMNAGWHKNVWSNSTITAVYSLKEKTTQS